MIYSVVIPVCNESKSIAELIERVEHVFVSMGKENDFEIIFVDDGSTDTTRQLLCDFSRKKQYVHAVLLRNNFGKSCALTAGFTHAQGAYIITMDGDLQDQPEEIPALIEKLNEGYDLVTGWRQYRRDGMVREIGSWLFNYVVSWLGGKRLHDYNCGFKMYAAQAAQGIVVYGQQHRFIPLLAHFAGYKVTEIPVQHQKRKYGNSRYPALRYQGFFDLLSILFIYRFRFSPLYFFGIVSAVFTVPSALVIMYFGLNQILYLLGIGNQFNVLTQNRPLFAFSLTVCLIGIQIFLSGLVCEFLLHHLWEKRRDGFVQGFIEEVV